MICSSLDENNGLERLMTKTSPTDTARSAKERRKEQTAEAIEKRLDQQQRAMAKEVEQWGRDRDALETETQAVEEQGLHVRRDGPF